jgi:hypothetical protein
MIKINLIRIFNNAYCCITKYMSHRDIKNNLFLLKAEDGPLKYLAENNWDSYKRCVQI